MSVANEQSGVLADEFETTILEEGPREHASFSQDLESVADPDDVPPAVGKCLDLLHDWGEPRDRPTAEVVTVGESTGEDYAVNALKTSLLMPQKASVLTEHMFDDVVAVVVTVAAGKGNDSKVHRRRS